MEGRWGGRRGLCYSEPVSLEAPVFNLRCIGAMLLQERAGRVVSRQEPWAGRQVLGAHIPALPLSNSGVLGEPCPLPSLVFLSAHAESDWTPQLLGVVHLPSVGM